MGSAEHRSESNRIVGDSGAIGEGFLATGESHTSAIITQSALTAVQIEKTSRFFLFRF